MLSYKISRLTTRPLKSTMIMMSSVFMMLTIPSMPSLITMLMMSMKPKMPKVFLVYLINMTHLLRMNSNWSIASRLLLLYMRRRHHMSSKLSMKSKMLTAA